MKHAHLPLSSLLVLSAVACSDGASDLTGSGGSGATRDDTGTVGPGPVDGGGNATGSGSGSGSGGQSAAGGGTGAGPADCSGFAGTDFELCSSDGGVCGVVFTGGEGCTEVCASAGLTCQKALENLEDSCGGDETLAELACDSGHESDYCVCVGTGGPVGGTGGDGAGGGSGGDTSGGGSSGSGGSSGGTAGTGGDDGIGGAPAIGPATCGCLTSAGEAPTVNSTIVVAAGTTYDGGCKTFRANPDTLGDGDQSENQLPVFRVEDGATLKNVILNASAADGVHTYGDVNLQNIRWIDIGEDAMTVKESGTVNLNCGYAANGADKVFQVNAASTVNISNFTAKTAGKFMRQNGSTTFKVTVVIDHSDISDMDECIFRTDSSTSHVTLKNSRYSGIGDGLFIFGSTVENGASGQSAVSNNQPY